MANQEINCSVDNCKYNSHEKHCTLNDIMVGCDCTNSEAKSEKETKCASFEIQ